MLSHHEIGKAVVHVPVTVSMFGLKHPEAVALRIPEVLELVIDNLARLEELLEPLARGNNGSRIYDLSPRRDLRSAALVNTLWYEIAIDKLWAVCPIHVFFDLPASRQQFYAGKIRYLRSEKIQGVRDPETPKKSKLVDISFPHLESIDLQGDDCDNMEQFIQPSLKTIRMQDFLHSASEWAESCGQRCTNVESLILEWFSSPGSAPSATEILEMVKSVRLLTSLHINIAGRVDVDLLVYLFKGSAIQDLTLKNFVTADSLQRIYNAPLDVVPCIKRLEIFMRHGVWFLVPVVASTLTILNITLEADTDEFFSLLPTIKGLRELTVSLEGRRLTGAAFSAIARLVNLEKLEIGRIVPLGEGTIDATEQEFVTSMSQLPRLRHVHLGAFRGTNFSFAALVPIGLKCRLLEHFHVLLQYNLTSSAAIICDNQEVLLPNLRHLFLEVTSPADFLPERQNSLKNQIFPKKRLVPKTPIDQSTPERTPPRSVSKAERAAARPLLDFLAFHAPKLRTILGGTWGKIWAELTHTVITDFYHMKYKTNVPQNWDAEWKEYRRHRQVENYRGQVKSLSDKWKKLVLPGT